jgi:hypothetical protein
MTRNHISDVAINSTQHENAAIEKDKQQNF